MEGFQICLLIDFSAGSSNQMLLPEINKAITDSIIVRIVKENYVDNYFFMLLGLNNKKEKRKLGCGFSIDKSTEQYLSKEKIISTKTREAVESLLYGCFEYAITPNPVYAIEYLSDILKKSNDYDKDWFFLEDFVLLNNKKSNSLFWDINSHKLKNHSYGLINIGNLFDDGSDDLKNKFWETYK